MSRPPRSETQHRSGSGGGGEVPGRVAEVFEGAAVTAVGLAASRSVETGTQDRLISDPLARQLFEAAELDLPMRLDWPATGVTPTPQEALHLHGSRYIGLRTRFYDDQLLAATAADVQQAVLIGAGLDTRAYRLALPAELRLFELDRGELLDWKRAQLRRLRANPRCVVTDVDVDLREDWPAALKAAGHDDNRPTMFLAEGLLAYLDGEAQRRLVAHLCDLAAPASRLAVDRISGNPQRGGRLDDLTRRSGIDMSDLIAGGDSQALERVLSGRGWQVQEMTTLELAAQYGRYLGDPFGAVDEPAAEPPWLDTLFLVGGLAARGWGKLPTVSEHQQSQPQPPEEPGRGDTVERDAQSDDPTSPVRGFHDLDEAEEQAEQAEEG